MTQKERRTAEETEETLVITETEQGYRVYAPGNGKRTYVVTPDGDGFACSCGEYLRHASSNPDWQCSHIQAVVSRMGGEDEARDEHRDATENEQATDQEARMPRKRKATLPGNGGPQMVLKRSASPDGRIDSLSVEFACPVADLARSAITEKARTLLAVQADIMQAFLGRKEKAPTPPPTPSQETTEPAVPARLLRVEGMDGKWGRRLFLTVQVNGEMTRLFGSQKQLAAQLAAAGFADIAEKVAEGLDLNLPCRVITKPSPDGRFVNVDRLLPADTPRTQARVR